MYGEHEWRTVHTMRAKGMSKATIARTLAMSRNTAGKLVRMKQPPRFKGRAKLTMYEQEVLRSFARILLEQALLVLSSKK